jgi:CYTH domain-containing protein
MVEIERKFLVRSNAYKLEAFASKKIVQGFLNTHPERTVRIRIQGNDGFITVKGLGNKTGTTRFEWEKQITLQEATDLLQLCEPGALTKTRYEVKCGRHTFEVDEFEGENAGLVVAEIELRQENELFEKPAWLGEEITGQQRYYNSQLSKNPFKNWKDAN